MKGGRKLDCICCSRDGGKKKEKDEERREKKGKQMKEKDKGGRDVVYSRHKSVVCMMEHDIFFLFLFFPLSSSLFIRFSSFLSFVFFTMQNDSSIVAALRQLTAAHASPSLQAGLWSPG